MIWEMHKYDFIFSILSINLKLIFVPIPRDLKNIAVIELCYSFCYAMSHIRVSNLCMVKLLLRDSMKWNKGNWTFRLIKLTMYNVIYTMLTISYTVDVSNLLYGWIALITIYLKLCGVNEHKILPKLYLVTLRVKSTLVQFAC